MARGRRIVSGGQRIVPSENAAIGSDAVVSVVDDVNSSVTDTGLIIVDPATIGEFGDGSDTGSAGDTAGEPRKRRGRKPGSGSARTGKAQALDISGIEKLLYSGHMLLAGIAKTPEFALGESEASELAKAIGNVSRHYDVSASAKTVDIANLIMVCGMVYGSRIIAVRARKTDERKKRVAAASSDNAVVYPFPPVS